jgi:cytochrome c oxidase subunit 3
VSFLQKITESPWTDPGLDDVRHSHRFSERPDKRVGLVMFLAVVTSLFFLFVVAYIERMELGDWDPLQEPGVLWLNTALLLLASVFMQRARNQASAGKSPRIALVLSGVLVLAFLAGQWVAWQALAGHGYFSMARPAFAFFYVLTAVHALHLLGGLYVWARAVMRSANAEAADLKPTLELCAIYWHYLLLVWVVLFVLMLNT